MVSHTIDGAQRQGKGRAKMTDQKTPHAECASLLTAGLDTIAYMLYLETWLNTDEAFAELDDEFLQRLYEKWVTQWLPALSEPHCGDCTQVSATCIRCSVERLYVDAARILRVSNVQIKAGGALPDQET